MRSFSERKGLIKVDNTIQVDRMNETLRNSLWNVLDIFIWKRAYFMYSRHRYEKCGMDHFSQALWFRYFKKPLDQIPGRSDDTLAVIRHHFFASPWNGVYDFLEFVADYYAKGEDLKRALNSVLEDELSGYRLVSGSIVEITEREEVQMLEEALRDTKFSAVTAHLQRALELMANRDKPDYRNSIKESISAVESMARIITGNDKATLGDALKEWEKSGKLHPALRNGFSSLYGYTGDADGIRHAMLEVPNLTAHDAKFFLLSCTSFVNYLKSKLV